MDGRTTRPNRCTATCVDGSPCRAWAVRGTDPPRCAPHGGGRAPVGAPKGNQNARTHGFYARSDIPRGGWTIELVIADLSDKLAYLSRYIDERFEEDDVDPMQFGRLMSLYGANASRLGRLLKIQRAMRDPLDERLERLVDRTREQFFKEYGIEL